MIVDVLSTPTDTDCKNSLGSNLAPHLHVQRLWSDGETSNDAWSRFDFSNHFDILFFTITQTSSHTKRTTSRPTARVMQKKQLMTTADLPGSSARIFLTGEKTMRFAFNGIQMTWRRIYEAVRWRFKADVNWNISRWIIVCKVASKLWSLEFWTAFHVFLHVFCMFSYVFLLPLNMLPSAPLWNFNYNSGNVD
jgi:hypothetical protein